MITRRRSPLGERALRRRSSAPARVAALAGAAAAGGPAGRRRHPGRRSRSTSTRASPHERVRRSATARQHKTLATGRGRCAAASPRIGPHPRRRGRRRRRRDGHRRRRVRRRRAATAACRSCTCPPRCSAWSTPPSAARPASTCPRARTWSARSGSRPACSATSTRWPRCRRASGAAGDGEMAKYHFLTGDDLLALPLAERVARCVAIKADGRRRRRARGRRAGPLLNYGHTLGPRPRDRRPTTTCATARRSPSAWSTPPSWPRVLGRIDDARVAEHRDVVGGAYDLRHGAARRPRPRRAGRAHGPRQEGASTALTFVLDGPARRRGGGRASTPAPTPSRWRRWRRWRMAATRGA